jgi:hypothetical protein
MGKKEKEAAVELEATKLAEAAEELAAETLKEKFAELTQTAESTEVPVEESKSVVVNVSEPISFAMGATPTPVPSPEPATEVPSPEPVTDHVRDDFLTTAQIARMRAEIKLG